MFLRVACAYLVDNFQQLLDLYLQLVLLLVRPSLPVDLPSEVMDLQKYPLELGRG